MSDTSPLEKEQSLLTNLREAALAGQCFGCLKGCWGQLDQFGNRNIDKSSATFAHLHCSFLKLIPLVLTPKTEHLADFRFKRIPLCDHHVT